MWVDIKNNADWLTLRCLWYHLRYQFRYKQILDWKKKKFLYTTNTYGSIYAIWWTAGKLQWYSDINFINQFLCLGFLGLKYIHAKLAYKRVVTKNSHFLLSFHIKQGDINTNIQRVICIYSIYPNNFHFPSFIHIARLIQSLLF